MHRFKSKIVPPTKVYDGDTIENVFITLISEGTLKFEGLKLMKGQTDEIWPEILLDAEGLKLRFNLRIDGIDTPEMHPRSHYLDGTARTEESIQKEKEMAVAARNALIDLIKEGNNEIYVSQPKEGKYARRMVCTCEVKIKDEYINVADYLIKKNLGKPYEGGTKSKWT